MSDQKPRLWVRVLGRAIAVAAVFIVIFANAGAAYQWIALRRDRRLNPMPGRLVNVGGYRMHIECVGQGSPTVILDAGLGDTWLAWYKVQPLIARFTRVCSYDRAGMGWSDPSPKPRTAEVIAEELHRLLQNARVAGPYLLVGHSLGGMYVRMFAGLYRNETSALVLVDSVIPHQNIRLPRSVTTYNNHFLRVQTWKEDTMFLGLPRLMGWCGNGPAEIRAELRTVDCRSGPWKEHMAEYETDDESSEQVLKAGPLGELPVVVISEDLPKGNVWNVLQASLAQISTVSCRIIAKGTGHMIPMERPHLIADVVRDLIEHLRTPHTPSAVPVETVLKEFGCAR